MSTISSLGVGSNLDLSGLLDKLATAESQPLVAMKTQQTSYNAKFTAYGTLQGALSAFQAAAKKLADASLFQGVKVASSAADVLSASASATGASGSYSVEVSKLATAQSLVAAGQASATAVIGTGSVTIDFGTITGDTGVTYNASTGKYSGAGFTPDTTRAAASVTIDASNNSLEGIRDAINKNSAIGITASIVNDGSASPYRLVFNSTQTGVTSSIRIAVTGDTALKSLLDHNPQGSGVQNLQQTAAADNAALTVNGIAITSTTNTVKEAVQGVTMTLAKSGLSSLTISRDNVSVEKAVSQFVGTYNSLLGTASYLTKYDSEKKTGSALVGDATLRTIQTGIRAALNTPQAGELQVLSKVGVTFEKDGSLKLDETKLKSALVNSATAVAALFVGTGGNTGLGTQVAALIDGFVGTSGKLTNAAAGVKTTLKLLDTRYAANEVNVNAKVARYRTQFTQLDVLMSKMNATTAYLTAQFSAMNASASPK